MFFVLFFLNDVFHGFLFQQKSNRLKCRSLNHKLIANVNSRNYRVALFTGLVETRHFITEIFMSCVVTMDL